MVLTLLLRKPWIMLSKPGPFPVGFSVKLPHPTDAQSPHPTWGIDHIKLIWFEWRPRSLPIPPGPSNCTSSMTRNGQVHGPSGM